MKRLVAGCVAAALAFGLAACSDPLDVKNLVSPDIERALASPSGIEQLISTGYQQVHLEQTNCCPVVAQMDAFSLENYASVANFGMGLRVSIARSAIQNDRGNPQGGDNYDNFRDLSKIARSMVNGIQALDRMKTAGQSLASPASAGRDARARAFAFFVLGLAQGNLALVYDSVSVITHADGPEVIPPLVKYDAAMTVALTMLDSAIATANGVASSQLSAFTVPDTWINGYGMTRDQFVRLVRSFKARFRASVARNPTERAAVNWTEVLNDVNAGVTSDVIITLSNSAGWSNGWLVNKYRYEGWHMMAPNYIGFADSAGGQYDTWVTTNMNRTGGDPNRFYFFRSADRRFPSGDTPSAQIASSGCTAGNNTLACLPVGSGIFRFPYFRHRNGGDSFGDPWAQSAYDHYRFGYIVTQNANRDGPWPAMTKAEMDLLAAEAYIRANDFANAVTRINLTRTTNGGLPSAAGATGSFANYNAGTAVSGGNACVPRVPVNNLTGRACGDLVEALKWEKRLETAGTGWSQWYFDSRGWGDLAEGTAVHWPVPYQELDSRTSGLTQFYTRGGAVENDGTPKSRYGW